MPQKLRKIIYIFLCFILIFQQMGFAQIAGQLDISGCFAVLHNSITVDKFRPLHLRYLSYDAEANTFRLLLDKGNLANPKPTDLEKTSKELLQYFFIGLTLPNDTFWVNLRPDSPDNIIDPYLAQTDIGRIMLESDLQLKKDTARFTSPQTPEGREYWDKLYNKAGEIFGSQDITIPTLTRPWIVPDEIIIRETADSAYVYKATLKVMLEQDYLKGSSTYSFKDPRLKQLNEYSSQLIRELIIPKLTQEINTSKRYASLRQVYYSLILAQWFKARFSGKNTAYSRLIDRHNLNNLMSKEDWSKTHYFQEYQKSFQQGEYNIKEPVYTPSGQTIRSYFSGGISGIAPVIPLPGQPTTINPNRTSVTVGPALAELTPPNKPYLAVVEAKATDNLGNVVIQNKPTGSSPVRPQESTGVDKRFTRWLAQINPKELRAEIELLRTLTLLLNNLESGDAGIQAMAAGAVKSLAEAGLLNKEMVKNKLSLTSLINNLESSDSEVQAKTAEAVKALAEAGLLDKEMVKNKLSLTSLLNNLESRDSVVQVEAAKAFKALAEAGLLDKEMVKNKLSLTSLLNNLESSNPGVQAGAVKALKSLAEAGLLDKEMVKNKLYLTSLINNLESGGPGVQVRAAETVKALAEAGLLDKEMVRGELLTSLLNNLESRDSVVQVMATGAVKSLAEAGLLDKEMVKNKLSLTSLINNLESSDPGVQERAAETVKSLAEAGLLDKEMGGRRVDLSGSGISVSEQFRYYYLRLLEILKADPVFVYQLFSWKPEEIVELVQILDYLPTYGNRYSLEKALINGGLTRIENLQEFISKLKSNIKTVIRKSTEKFAIRVYEIASVNATRGLINALGLGKENVVILYDKEIDSKTAEKFFPGYVIRPYLDYAEKGVIRMEFHDYGNMRMNSSGDSLSVSLPYTPFKLNLPEPVLEEETNAMRTSLAIGSRKIIVIGSPSDTELNEFITSYNSLYGNLLPAQRPLLIIGSRQRGNENDSKLLGSLSGQSIVLRSDNTVSLPNMEGHNVLILNTSGELLKMYALADVAIVGNDRNIFEPASQRAAVLYFEGNWQNNRKAKDALVNVGAARVFSKKELERLLNSSVQAKEMVQNGLGVVREYKKEVEAQAERFALQIIDRNSQLRDKLIAASSSSPIQDRSLAESKEVFSPITSPGGIDFRALPIVTQAISNLSLATSRIPVGSLGSVNLNKEWLDIERMLDSGITPSAERLKEYVQASTLKGDLDKEKVISCIADILRQEEEKAGQEAYASTDPVLKDLLVVLESASSNEELKAAFIGSKP